MLSLLLFLSLLSAVVLLTLQLLSQIRKHLLYFRFIPRPSVGAYSLITRIYRTPAVETADWFNREFRRARSPLLFVRGPLFLSEVFVGSADGMRALTQAGTPYVKAAPIVSFVESFTGPESIFISEGPRHRLLRSALAPALKHDHIVRHLQHSFFDEARRLADAFDVALAQGQGKCCVDPLKVIRDSTFRIIANACFGQHFLSPPEVDELCTLYHQALGAAPVSQILNVLFCRLPGMATVVELVSPVGRAKAKLRLRVRALCDRLVSSSGEQEHLPRESFLRSLLNNADELGLSVDELAGTVLAFLLAGQATTTIAVAWALYVLAEHVEWQERVLREVQTVPDDLDSLEALDGLPTLNALVKETIRLYPPVLYALRSVLHPTKGGTELEGQFLPNGTSVRINILAAQTNPDTWGEDAISFNPGRWNRPLHPDAKWMWSSFWHGSHSCIGQRFAILEIKAFVTTVIKRFRVSINKEKDGTPVRMGINSNSSNLKLHFAYREA